MGMDSLHYHLILLSYLRKALSLEHLEGGPSVFVSPAEWQSHLSMQFIDTL